MPTQFYSPTPTDIEDNYSIPATDTGNETTNSEPAIGKFSKARPGANNFHQRVAVAGGLPAMAAPTQATQGSMRGLGFAREGLDAPDQNLREISLKMQYAPGSLTTKDFRRLAQRQGVEKMPGVFGPGMQPQGGSGPTVGSIAAPVAGASNDRSIQSTMAANNQQRGAGSISEQAFTANQQMRTEQNLQESNMAQAKGRAAAATIRTHGADLGMSEDEIKGHLAQLPGETRNAYSSRLLETVSQSNTTNTARRQQQALESADAARANTAETRATKAELDASRFALSQQVAENNQRRADEQLAIQKQRNASEGIFETYDEAANAVKQAAANGQTLVVKTNRYGQFQVSSLGEKREDLMGQVINGLNKVSATPPAVGAPTNEPDILKEKHDALKVGEFFPWKGKLYQKK